MGTTDGIAAGSVPSPSVSGDNPGWMYRNTFLIAGQAVDAAELVHIEKDLRAMRKFGAQDRDVALVVDPLSGGTTVSMSGIVRLLILLP